MEHSYFTTTYLHVATNRGVPLLATFTYSLTPPRIETSTQEALIRMYLSFLVLRLVFS